MAKAFDLVHKIAKNTEEGGESRIPFEDEGNQGEPPKKKVRVEIIFFYILLFIIFFLMGATFLSPNLLAGVFGKKHVSTSPPATAGPNQGLTIDQQGSPSTDAVTPPSASPSGSAVVPSSTPTSQPQSSSAAKIQVLNGTNKTGAAAAARTKLAKAGIVVASIGNYSKRSVARTTIYYKPDYKTAAIQIQNVLGGILSATSTGIGAYDVLVVIGLK